MYTIDSILDIKSLYWCFWIAIFTIGVVTWLLGRYKEKPVREGLVGFNKEGFPIYCDIINVGGYSVPVYHTSDYRGVPKQVDENWNIVK